MLRTTMTPALGLVLLGLTFGTSTANAQQLRAERNIMVIDGGLTEMIETAEVAAFRDGILEAIEFDVGDYVPVGEPIGQLHSEMAAINMAKAKKAAEARGPLQRARAQMRAAEVELERIERLRQIDPRSFSLSEYDQARAAVLVATAQVQEAEEQIDLNRAEYELSRRIVDEHQIVAPIEGKIVERYKNPGEGVRANEPVVKIVRLNRLRVFAFLTESQAQLVREGMAVQIEPKIAGVQLSEDRRFFGGKITFVDPQSSASKNTKIRIYAEIENTEDFFLRAGWSVQMVIDLDSLNQGPVGATTRAARPVVRNR